MRYIKTYEDISHENRFWKVNTKMPEFAISLEKIGVPKNKQLRITEPIEYNEIKKYDYVYIGVEPNNAIILTWDENSSSYGNARYMGEIEISEDDIKEWKFNDNINKYNL